MNGGGRYKEELYVHGINETSRGHLPVDGRTFYK